MAKIQPQQYEPYSPNSPSGNIHAVVGDDFINFYLLNSISGDFNIDGGLTINGITPTVSDSSNDFGGTRVFVVGGENNFATGQDTSILNATNSTASGIDNTIFCGDQNEIVDSNQVTILAGRNVVVGAGYDGCVLIGDSNESRLKSPDRENSFKIDVSGGVFVQNEMFVSDNIYVASAKSGLFSGDLNVLGNAYNSGSKLINFVNYTGWSGQARSDMTGVSGSLYSDINSLSGKVTGEYVSLGTSQTINSIKYFTSNIDVATNVVIGGTGASDSYIQPAWNPTGSSVTGSSIKIETPNSVAIFLDNDGDGNYHDKSYEFTKNGFSIYAGIGGHDSNNRIFGISPSGMVEAKQGLIIDQPYVPATYTSSGHSGQMAWSGRYFYLATGENRWGRVLLAPW